MLMNTSERLSANNNDIDKRDGISGFQQHTWLNMKSAGFYFLCEHKANAVQKLNLMFFFVSVNNEWYRQKVKSQKYSPPLKLQEVPNQVSATIVTWGEIFFYVNKTKWVLFNHLISSLTYRLGSQSSTVCQKWFAI